ncbi:rhomboid family intramembrane serine protease GlpG [Thalassomonas haliotis]|uniref:Rhomboid family intramembrane serine protease GlpG n=1 Tax=Thalassomonas haliotis TaxID=485448 RepID=A0ABY7VDC6_9GAMM|nr:rhomboid family intramembrane serine protease GlpG [Thalassomonas haliotis]WDE11675.1 rhomboid family intramembrane serine protease GlpG [Thalassomonas haliotis]
MTEQPLQALVQINQQAIALLFVNHLTSLGIRAEAVNEQDVYVVYCPPDKISQAKEEFEQFSQQPYHPKYQQAAWQHGNAGQVQSDGPSLLASFKEHFLAHAGLVTLTVFVLCWLVFVASLFGGARYIFSYLQFYPQLSWQAFFDQPLRLLGPAFFHFSWLHIVFNTMWWWQLGGSVEKVLGKGVLVHLLLLSAITANVGQYLVSGANFGGLSGVVYGLVGFVWWMGWLAPEKGLFLSKPIVGFLLFWLLLGYADVLPINMANTAHLLGLISGCLLALAQAVWKKRT